MKNCELCESIKEKHRLIEKNDFCFAIINLEPLKKGHIMVLPKRHIEKLSELSEQESKAIFDMIDNLKNRLNKKYSEDVIIFINTGKHSSESHLHLHVLPSKGNIRNFFQNYEKVVYRKRLSNEELKKFKDDLKVIK